MGTARANECSDIDLREAPALRSMIIENQGPHGTCYAYASASLINSRVLSRDINSANLVSPLEMAAFGNDDETLDGGFERTAINNIRARGKYCPRAHLEEWLNRFVGEGSESRILSLIQGDLSLKNRMIMLQKLKRITVALSQGDEEDIETRLIRIRADLAGTLLEEGFECDHPDSLQLMEENVRFLQGLGNWIVENAQGSERAMTQQIINFACDGHWVDATELAEPQTSSNRLTNTRLGGLLDEALERTSREPVSIGICANFLHKPVYSGIEMRDGNRTAIEDDCGGHALLVVGRRADPAGRCQYLLRNSWGENVTYHQDFESTRGGVWVDRDILLRNTFDITILGE